MNLVHVVNIAERIAGDALPSSPLIYSYAIGSTSLSALRRGSLEAAPFFRRNSGRTDIACDSPLSARKLQISSVSVSATAAHVSFFATRRDRVRFATIHGSAVTTYLNVQTAWRLVIFMRISDGKDNLLRITEMCYKIRGSGGY